MFKVYKDADIGIDLDGFVGRDGREAFVESAMDDDANSDQDTVEGGKRTCFRDLLAAKDYLNHPPDRMRRALKTFRFWAPLFRGTLPYKRRTRSLNLLYK